MSEDIKQSEDLVEQQDFEDNQEPVEQDAGYIDNVDDYVEKTGKPADTFRTKDEYDEFGKLRKEITELRGELKASARAGQLMAASYTDLDKKAYDRAMN